MCLQKNINKNKNENSKTKRFKNNTKIKFSKQTYRRRILQKIPEFLTICNENKIQNLLSLATLSAMRQF